MSQVRLYSVNASGSHPATRAEIGALSSAFERMSAPDVITLARMSKEISPFTAWRIRLGREGPAVSVGEWFEQLTTPILEDTFRARLTTLSKPPLLRGHKSALAPFNVGRFCEFRAALAAQRIEGVRWVQIIRPNSDADRRKIDLLVLPARRERATPIQVKAATGTGSGRGRIPVLGNVWNRDLSAIKHDIATIISSRVEFDKRRLR